MARKRHTAEEIVSKRRQVDVLMAQGRGVEVALLLHQSLRPLVPLTLRFARPKA